jgi:hypothetical protein
MYQMKEILTISHKWINTKCSKRVPYMYEEIFINKEKYLGLRVLLPLTDEDDCMFVSDYMLT